ncbi:MAG: hypothetical protein ACXACX_12020 [Candidatus Hodarchaeales archaeon]
MNQSTRSDYMQKLPLLLFAGEGRNLRVAELLERAEVEYRALIKLNGKTMIYRVLEAFAESGIISDYFICGIPQNLVELPDSIDSAQVHFIEAQGMSYADRIAFGAKHILEQIPNQTQAMHATADIPFLSGKAIRDFYDLGNGKPFDLVNSVVTRDSMEGRFGETKRTYVPIRVEGKVVEYCLGDLAIINLEKVEGAVDNFRAFRRNRKRVLMIILVLQPGIIFRYLLKRLRFSDVEKALNKVFKAKTHVVHVDHPELAMDVDNIHQYELVLREFNTG